MPNAPSVKYNGFIYPSEEECMVARYEYMKHIITNLQNIN
jgi:hypothetical protein